MVKETGELNIVYTVDDAYLPLVSISLASIIENNKRNIVVYIATDKDDNTANFKKLKEHHESKTTHIQFLNCHQYDSLFEKYNMNRWGSNSFYIYWRLVAFDLLEVRKAIYVDSDILCLKEITWPDLHDKAVGCVLDSVHSCYNHYLGVDSQFPVYNTGTMFVDVQKWKENGCTAKCLDYIKNVRSQFMMADQDLFSLALEKEAVIISPRYNWFAGYDYYGIEKSFRLYDLDKKRFYTREELLNDQKDIMMYHCLDGVFSRPWIKNNEHPAKSLFEHYRKLSAWKDFEKDRKQSSLFKVEKKMEKILPEGIYCRIHNLAIRLDIRNKNR